MSALDAVTELFRTLRNPDEHTGADDEHHGANESYADTLRAIRHDLAAVGTARVRPHWLYRGHYVHIPRHATKEQQ